MSAVESLLRELSGLGVRMWAEGDRLRYSAPKSTLNDAFLTRIRAHKPELLSLLGQAAATPTRSIAPVPRDGELLPSFGQERLWFLQQFEGASAAYNIPSAMRVLGRLNLTAVKDALRRILQRHEVLRTSFTDRDGRCAVVIADEVAVDLPVTDLSHLRGEAQTAETMRLAQEEFLYTFDLARAPLLRTSVLRLGEEDHVVLINLHHIVSDGWSTAVFVSEFCRFYEEYAAGIPVSRPPLPIQYADYAMDQRRRLSRGNTAADLAFWTRLMEGVPPVLDLPGDYPRPGVQSFEGGSIPISIPAPVADKLREISHKAGATLFMTLLGAFAAVLHRYSRQSKIAVGSPVANRNSPETEPLIGFFLNTLVIPVDLTGNPSFLELVVRVRQLALDVFAHQDLPFEHLVEALQPVRTLSHSPVFQVMFILQNNREEPVSIAGLEFRPIALPSSTEKFDLTLSLSETAGAGMAGELGYNRDLFAPSTAERLAGHFQNFVTAAAAYPEKNIDAIPLLSPAETRQIVYEWNDTARPLPQELRIHGLVERQVQLTPRATALVFEDCNITYSDYNGRANRLAHYLIALGVGPEVRVGICIDRSIEMMVALLAVLKAGGAYVPLDTSYPASRIAFMLEDADVAVLLTLERHLAALPTLSVPVLCLDPDGPVHPALAAQSASNPLSPVTADNLAYIIYTSGSTGRPKGVMNAHRGVANRLLWGQETFGMKPDDSIVQKTPIGFDVSVWEMLWPLTTGARLVIAKPGGHRDSAYLVDLIERFAITTIHFVAPMLGSFLEEDLSRCGSLRRVLTSGEALSPEMQRRFFERLSVPLDDLYGPTEAAIEVSHWACERNSALRSVPIGRPVANTRLYILDGSLQPTPIGVPGELHIGGICVARGYWKRPGLTAGVFLPDPFSPLPGARMYRTGDAARFFPDGNIDFLGRLDQQIKIRGFRVELGEIESALQSIPSVREAVVLMRDNRLVAFVIPTALTPAERDLRDSLGVTLPEHMIPARFVFLESFPIAPNGKLNRTALPDPVSEVTDAAFAEPQTPAELALAAIWADVLGLPKVGIRDDFFAIGGDSISSTRIAARARRAGYRVTLKQIFQFHTVAELAAVAEPLAAMPAAAIAGDDAGPVPLTPVQRRFLESAADPRHYNQAVVLAVTPGFDPERLAAALTLLVLRHDALRFRFRRSGDDWFQQRTAASVAVPMLRRLRGKMEQHTAALQTAIDPVNGPVFEAAFFDRGSETGILLLIAHHLVVDGVSWRILLDELSGILGGAELPAPPSLSFAAWSRWLSDYAGRGEGVHEIGYWRSLARRRFPQLPTDHQHDAETNTFGSVESVTLELETANHPSLHEALLASVVDALTVWTGGSSALIELEGHGRGGLPGAPDAGETVGWFTTAWPVALDRSYSPALAIPAIRDQLEVVPNGGAGYGILRWLNRHPDLIAMQTPEVAVNYLGRFDEGFSNPAGPLVGFSGESPGPMIAPNARRTHKIEVTALVTRGKLRITWAWSRNLHRRETIEKLAHTAMAGLGQILQAQTRNPVEAVYPLTPSQLGILLESLAHAGTGIHIEQSSWAVRGNLDSQSLISAFAAVVAHHPALRTCFLPEARPAPLQTVFAAVPDPLYFLDWTPLDPHELNPGEQDARLAKFLAIDRARGFPPDSAPLFRLTVVKLAGDRWQLIATYHHLVMDGWSLPLVFGDAMLAYRATLRGERPHLPPAPPYSEYVTWLRRRDSVATEDFWRGALRGFKRPTRVAPRAPVATDTGAPHERTEIATDAAITEQLQAVARAASVTLNTLIQGAWALLLCWWSGDGDVVFGQTVSGRPADLSHAEAIVGMFTNTIPVRCAWLPDVSLHAYLGEIQAGQLQANGHSWCSSAQIHQQSELPPSSPLYETILVFENYPVERVSGNGPMPFEVVEAHSSGARTNTPLTVLVAPGRSLRLHAVADSALWEHESLRIFFAGFVRILREIAVTSDPNNTRTPAQIIAVLPAPPVLQAHSAQAHSGDYAAPRTAREAQLVTIWEELLGLPQVGVRDNFFQLGGHSLLALRLVDRIESEFHRRVPLSALVQAPTIEALAEVLDSAAAASQTLIALRTSAAETAPLFCVHPLGGSVVCYAELARPLGSDYRVYALQARGVEDGELPAASMDEMAADYVEAIRAAGPGPYRLLGYSFGGFVALRMAVLLREKGEQVARVILLDVPHPSVVPPEMARTDDSGLLVSLFAGSLELSLAQLRQMEQPERLTYVYTLARQAGLVPPGMPFDRARRYFEIARTNHNMEFKHTDCAFPVTLIRAEEGSVRISTLPDLGWRAFVTGSLEVVWSPGMHETMLNPPHTASLAAAVRAALSR